MYLLFLFFSFAGGCIVINIIFAFFSGENKGQLDSSYILRLLEKRENRQQNKLFFLLATHSWKELVVKAGESVHIIICSSGGMKARKNTVNSCIFFFPFPLSWSTLVRWEQKKLCYFYVRRKKGGNGVMTGVKGDSIYLAGEEKRKKRRATYFLFFFSVALRHFRFLSLFSFLEKEIGRKERRKKEWIILKVVSGLDR